MPSPCDRERRTLRRLRVVRGRPWVHAHEVEGELHPGRATPPCRRRRSPRCPRPTTSPPTAHPRLSATCLRTSPDRSWPAGNRQRNPACARPKASPPATRHPRTRQTPSAAEHTGQHDGMLADVRNVHAHVHSSSSFPRSLDFIKAHARSSRAADSAAACSLANASGAHDRRVVLLVTCLRPFERGASYAPSTGTVCITSV